MFAEGAVIDGKYKIRRRIGEGGMGVVYAGENIRINRLVAIKVLHPELARERELVERFQLEARAAARIGSAHIVDVLDMGEIEDGSCYIVMEYLEGENLAQVIERDGPRSAAYMSGVAVQVLDALAHAHDAGIVHRDLKPDNVFLARRTGGDFVKLLDFGVSKFRSGSLGSQRVTLTGVVMGTPAYMSPEQARGRSGEVDYRSDIYALGVILYECLGGRLPFVGENVQQVLFSIALEQPTPLSDLAPTVDAGMAAIVHKAMARTSVDRYQSAAEMANAIAAWRAAQGLDIVGISMAPRVGVVVSSFPHVTSSDPPQSLRVPPAPLPVTGGHTPSPWEAGGTGAARGSLTPSFQKHPGLASSRRGLSFGAVALASAALAGLLVWRLAPRNEAPDSTVASVPSQSGAQPSIAITPITSSLTLSPPEQPTARDAPLTTAPAANDTPSHGTGTATPLPYYGRHLRPGRATADDAARTAPEGTALVRGASSATASNGPPNLGKSVSTLPDAGSPSAPHVAAPRSAPTSASAPGLLGRKFRTEL